MWRNKITSVLDHIYFVLELKYTLKKTVRACCGGGGRVQKAHARCT